MADNKGDMDLLEQRIKEAMGDLRGRSRTFYLSYNNLTAMENCKIKSFLRSFRPSK